MPKFLIEVPHDAATIGCARTVETFLKTGSHFLSHAHWGCRDGVHKSWMIVEVDSKSEARGIVPPGVRDDAKVVQLNTFTIDEIESVLREHRS